MGTQVEDSLRLKNDFRYQQAINSSDVQPLNSAPMHLVDKLAPVTGYQGFALSFAEPWQGPVGDGTAGGWTVTSVDGGGDAGEVVGIRDTDEGGVLRILTNDADNDNTQLQMAGSVFKYNVGKQMWFFAKVAVEDANLSDLAMGLIIESDTNMINTFPTDGIFFEKVTVPTEMDFHVRKNGASTESTLITGTLADDTFRVMGFHVDVAGNVHAYDGTTFQNMVKVATVAVGNANIPDDVALTPAFQVQTGGAATRYMDIKAVMVAQEQAKA